MKIPLLGRSGRCNLRWCNSALENEYGAESRVEAAPWKVGALAAADIKEDDAGRSISLPTGARIAYDMGNNPVLLFENEWSANYFGETNPLTAPLSSPARRKRLRSDVHVALDTTQPFQFNVQSSLAADVIWSSAISDQEAILERATLGIQEGDHIGLVGRNGSGKTTFLVKSSPAFSIRTAAMWPPRRDLIVSYLPQDFMLDQAKNVVRKHQGRRKICARR